MTYSDTQPRGTLTYRLLSQEATKTPTDPGLWGHEYIRHLSAELGAEYALRVDKSEDISSLRSLALECATFLLHHNAEADAVDLLEELECVGKIGDLVDDDTYARVCLYMVSCVPLLAPPDDVAFLRTAHTILSDHKKYPEAMALAIRLGDPQLIYSDFHKPANPLMRKQLAFLLARAQIPLRWVGVASEDETEEMTAEYGSPVELEQDMLDILNNTNLLEHFKAFGKELSVEEPKSLEDIYKTHLENTRELHLPCVYRLSDRLIRSCQVLARRMWTQRELIWPERLSMHLSTLASEMTSLWLGLKTGAVGSTRTRIMVC